MFFSPFSSKCSSRSIFPVVSSNQTCSTKQQNVKSRLEFSPSATADVPYITMDLMSSASNVIKIAGREVSTAKRLPTHTKQILGVANCQVSYHTSPPPPLAPEHFLMQSSPLLNLKLHKQLRPSPGGRLEWFTSVAPRERLLQQGLRQRAAKETLFPNGVASMPRRHGIASRRPCSAAAQLTGYQHSPRRPLSANIWLASNTPRADTWEQDQNFGLSVHSTVHQAGSTTARDTPPSLSVPNRRATDPIPQVVPTNSPLFSFAPTLTEPSDSNGRRALLAAGSMTASLPSRQASAHQGYPYTNASRKQQIKQPHANVLKTSSPACRRHDRQRGQSALGATQHSSQTWSQGSVSQAAWSPPDGCTVPKLARFASRRDDAGGIASTGAASHVHRFLRQRGVRSTSPNALDPAACPPGWYSDDRQGGMGLGFGH